MINNLRPTLVRQRPRSLPGRCLGVSYDSASHDNRRPASIAFNANGDMMLTPGYPERVEDSARAADLQRNHGAIPQHASRWGLTPRNAFPFLGPRLHALSRARRSSPAAVVGWSATSLLIALQRFGRSQPVAIPLRSALAYACRRGALNQHGPAAWRSGHRKLRTIPHHKTIPGGVGQVVENCGASYRASSALIDSPVSQAACDLTITLGGSCQPSMLRSVCSSFQDEGAGNQPGIE